MKQCGMVAVASTLQNHNESVGVVDPGYLLASGSRDQLI